MLGATLSGLWGIYSGFELCEAAALPDREEYSDSEKYAVKPRNWKPPRAISSPISGDSIDCAKPNQRYRPIRELHSTTLLTTILLYYGKYAPGESTRLMVIVNLNPQAGVEEADFEIPLWEWGLSDMRCALAVEDAFNGARFTWHGKIQRIRLAPDVTFPRLARISGDGGMT